MSPTLQPSTHPYAELTPDRVLDAVESLGLRTDGRLMALNSFENRVYQVGMDEGPPLIAKFYRPNRWSEAQILEEHAYTEELAAREIPVVPPLHIAGGTLAHASGFRFSLFARRGGRAPELDRPETLEWIGRFMGRIHAVGAIRPFAARPALDIDTFGREPRAFLLEQGFVPPELRDTWLSVVDQALEAVAHCWQRAGQVRNIRLHGDCHAGNVLWTERGGNSEDPGGPHFVDFDDARNGPAVQDLWMLLSGDAEAMKAQLRHVLAGYGDFFEFDDRELQLVEALRTLRLIHYAAWIARRWDDPAFPAAFPWFGGPRYWQDRILELREQIALMQESPLGAA
jgi:Ser/Thr protein kinase RdoA (MazF antagonist)